MVFVNSTVSILEREVYAEAEAARLLGVPQGTLHYWLEGKASGPKKYPPVIRPRRTGSRVVTWGEFVEAALLRRYREKQIPMLQLRRFIDTLRDDLEVPYPLAHARPWISGRDLLYAAQDASGLPTDFWLVANEQGVLSSVGQDFIDRVSWDNDVAVGLRPAADPDSPVKIDPMMRFGQPHVHGISTAAIFDEVEAGASYDEVAGDFDIPVADVRWAHAFESTKAA